MKKLLQHTVVIFALSVASHHSLACKLKDNGDGTMTDSGTNITIKKCLEGQRWNGVGCTGTALRLTWDDALFRYGNGDWRLITESEARRIVPQAEGCLIYSAFWTSSLLKDQPNIAHATDILYGRMSTYNRNDSDINVRLVRGGQPVATTSVNTNQSNSNLNVGNSITQPQQSSQQNQSTQQQPQQAQQQAQQAQDSARVAQTRADQARQGQRRRHEPENEASQCIQPDFGGLYGGMKNTCNFKVWYTYCGFRPKENSWLTGMSCEKQSFGSDSVSPGRTSASHTKGVESIHWIACKEPAWALDAEFVPGQGVKGRCYTVGGK